MAVLLGKPAGHCPSWLWDEAGKVPKHCHVRQMQWVCAGSTGGQKDGLLNAAQEMRRLASACSHVHTIRETRGGTDWITLGLPEV